MSGYLRRNSGGTSTSGDETSRSEGGRDGLEDTLLGNAHLQELLDQTSADESSIDFDVHEPVTIRAIQDAARDADWDRVDALREDADATELVQHEMSVPFGDRNTHWSKPSHDGSNLDEAIDNGGQNSTFSQMNCWEGVMYLSYLTNALDEDDIRGVYQQMEERGRTPPEGMDQNVFENQPISDMLGGTDLRRLGGEGVDPPRAGEILRMEETEGDLGHVALMLDDLNCAHLWTAGLTAPEGTSNEAKAYTGFEMLPYQELLDFYSTQKPNPLFSAGPLSPSGREATGSQDL